MKKIFMESRELYRKIHPQSKTAQKFFEDFGNPDLPAYPVDFTVPRRKNRKVNRWWLVGWTLWNLLPKTVTIGQIAVLLGVPLDSLEGTIRTHRWPKRNGNGKQLKVDIKNVVETISLSDILKKYPQISYYQMIRFMDFKAWEKMIAEKPNEMRMWLENIDCVDRAIQKRRLRKQVKAVEESIVIYYPVQDSVPEEEVPIQKDEGI